MQNYEEVIKNLLDTDDTEKIRTTVENFQLVEMPDFVVKYVTQKLETQDNGVRDILSRILSTNPNSNIPKYIVPYVSSKNIAARNLAGEILLKRKNNSIEALVEFIDQADEDTQKFIVDILGLLGDKKPEEVIINLLKNSVDENVILACIEALGNIKSGKSINVLKDFYDLNEIYRPTIIESLGKIGSEESTFFLNQNYAKENELSKFSLIESLGKIGNNESFDILLNDIQNLSSPYSWVAIETLGKLKVKLNLDLPVNEFLKSALLETLTTADLQYKRSALKLIEMFDSHDIIYHIIPVYAIEPEIDSILKEYFVTHSQIFFREVINYLEDNSSNLKSIIHLIQDVLQSDNKNNIQLLDELERQKMIEKFVNLLNHPDEELRVNSMELLFYLDYDTALSSINTMLDDPVVWNRARLLEILQYSDDPRIIEIIIEMTNDQDEMIVEIAKEILSSKGINNYSLKDDKC